MTGKVHVLFDNLPGSVEFVKAGKLKALATMLDVRSPLMPDLPTIIEAGQSHFPIVPWFALVGPADLPAEGVAHHEQGDGGGTRQARGEGTGGAARLHPQDVHAGSARGLHEGAARGLESRAERLRHRTAMTGGAT